MSNATPLSRNNSDSLGIPGALDSGKVDFLLARVLRGSERASPEPDWAYLVPRETLSYEREPDDGPAFLRLRTGEIVTFDPPAMAAAGLLSSLLRSRLGLRHAADEHEILLEVLNAVGLCVVGLAKTKGLGQRLLAELPSRLARSVTVFAVGGLKVDSGNPGSVIRIGENVIIGGIDEVTEHAIDKLSMSSIKHSFRFTHDAWWTEDYLGKRADPEAYDSEEVPDGLSVIAWVVDAVDYPAAVRARDAVEGLLGALWLIDQLEESWSSPPPWIVGTPTQAEYPRAPGVEDAQLPLVALQVSTRRHTVESIDFHVTTPVVDVRAAMASKHRDLIELVASVETSGLRQSLARRVSAACRFIRLAGQDRLLVLSLLYSVIALEALVSDHIPGAGVTDRFVRRLDALLSPEIQDDLLDLLYKLRSEIGHQGFTSTSASDSTAVAASAFKISHDAIIAVVELIKEQNLQTDVQLITWLDLRADARDVS